MERLIDKNINTNTYWNREYDRRIIRGNFKIQRKLMNKVKTTLLEDKDVKTVLDVGCGVGIFVKELKLKKLKARGIDHSKSSIRYAKRAYGKENFAIANVSSVKLKENSVDAITSLEVLEHLDEPMEVLQKLIKAARYMVIVTVPNGNAIKSKEHIWSFTEKDFNDLGFETEMFNDNKRILAVYRKENML